jgi:hypothetical protein
LHKPDHKPEFFNRLPEFFYVIRAENPKAIKLAKSASGVSGNNFSPEGGNTRQYDYNPLEEDINCLVKGPRTT